MRKSVCISAGAAGLLAGWLLVLTQFGFARPSERPGGEIAPAVADVAAPSRGPSHHIGGTSIATVDLTRPMAVPDETVGSEHEETGGPGPRGLGCPCPGDLDGNGIADELDLPLFVNTLLAGSFGGCADVNGDGPVDGADIRPFVGAVLAQQPCIQFDVMSFATSAQITVFMQNPPLGVVTLELDSNDSDNTTVQLEAEPYNTGQPIATEMISMQMTGNFPGIGAVILNESPVDQSHGAVDNVVATPTGGFVSGDSFLNVFVVLDFPDIGVSAFNPFPVAVQAPGISQLPPDIPHFSGPTNVPLVFDNPAFEGFIIDVIHNPVPVCIYELTCMDGPCNDCGFSLGDLCVGARCPGGTCSVGFMQECGDPTCCVEWTLVACAPSRLPPCPNAPFCPVCDPTPGACCLPDGSCIVATEAECKELGGPMAYQGDGTACAPPQKCCLADGSCIDTDPQCCTLVGGTPFPGMCAPPQKCCFGDGSCIDTDPMCCTLAGGTPFAGMCGPVEACCFGDGSCQNLDPDCCVIAGGIPDGPGLCIPPQKCCLGDDSCINADPACCVNVLGGTPFAGMCAPIEACCFPDGTCSQLEPDCCMNAGGTPDGVGPCEPVEACCLPGGTCMQAEPLCCINVLGGTPDGVRACMPVEACCLPDGTCVQAEPMCCTNVLGGTPDGIGPCLPLEACCFLDGTCTDADPLCCANVLGGTAQGAGTNCTPNPCPSCSLTSQTVSLMPANRARTTLGIAEDTTVSTVGGVVATWTVAGGGTVVPAVGASTLFTASRTPSVSTVTATLPGGVFCTRVFTVIPPTGINSVVNSNTGCVGGTMGPPNNQIGMRTIFGQTILPTTVSFWRANFRENIPGEAFVWPSGAAGNHPVQVVPYTCSQANGITDTSARCYDPIGVLDPAPPGGPLMAFGFPIRVPEEYLNQAAAWVVWLPGEDHPKSYTAAGTGRTSIVATNTANGSFQGPWQ